MPCTGTGRGTAPAVCAAVPVAVTNKTAPARRAKSVAVFRIHNSDDSRTALSGPEFARLRGVFGGAAPTLVDVKRGPGRRPEPLSFPATDRLRASGRQRPADPSGPERS